MTFRVVRPKMVIINLLFYGMGPAMAIAVISMSSFSWYDPIPLVIFSLMFSGFFYFFHYCVIRRIVINERGLEYHTLFKVVRKSWDEIDRIKISEGFMKRGSMGNPLFIIFYEKKDPDESFKYSDGFIDVHYRKKIVTELLKYYDKKIIGIQQAEQRDSFYESISLRNRVKRYLEKIRR